VGRAVEGSGSARAAVAAEHPSRNAGSQTAPPVESGRDLCYSAGRSD